METLESSRVCRLCGKQSGISINIFDKNENHVKKINAILPIMVHEMDLLPKHMCHRCSYKLEEFHKFYIDCLKTDSDLKSQLSWMRKRDTEERIGVPMVHIENIKIKAEPADYEIYELNPIVDNVNYINTMSSVTFPVNGVQTNAIHEGITYTAYTHCRCCCDKEDQSSQTVSADYRSTVPGCRRFNGAQENVRASDNGETMKRDLVVGSFQDRPNLCRLEAEDTRRTTTSAVKVNGANVRYMNKDNIAKSTIVRNLRPRRRSVDYVGRKKALVSALKKAYNNMKTKTVPETKFEKTRIKVEKLDDFEGRVLRPRKTTIDYLGPKRKYLKSMEKDQRSLQEKKRNVRNIASDRKLCDKLAIKQEVLSDLEDTILDPSTSRRTKKRDKNSSDNLDAKVDALPNCALANVQNEVMNYNTSRAQLRNNSVGNKFGSLSKTRNRLKSENADANRIAANYPRSFEKRNSYLGSEMRKFSGLEKSTRRLRKTVRSANDNRTIGKNSIKAVRGTVNSKKSSTALKLIGNSIKHYCEECNVSFANKELFKLHACYV